MNGIIKNERQLALDALLEIYQKGGYSNLVLAKLLPQKGKQKQMNAFVTALVYGVIERDLTLEYLMEQYSKKSCKKLDLEVSLILKMGLYQLLYLNSVPDNAAVDESVKLCYYVKKVSAKGFVNGVLRSFLRDGKKLVIRETDDLKALSIAYSCPLWLVEKWNEEYSYEQTKKLLAASLGRPPLAVRVNTLKTTLPELMAVLTEKKMAVQQSPYLDNCLLLDRTGNIERYREFREGHFYVQDLSSQFCARLADVKPGDRVFDLCAAPGSKSFTMAQYMENKGELVAFDLYDHKLELIEKTAEKLGIENLSVRKGDASQYQSELGFARVVLCDVPCAGLGIIRRKPEIKYKSREEIAGLPELQYAILENGSRYVEAGGRLVYSTCSLNREENQQVAERFLREHPEFEPVPIPEELSKNTLTEGNMVTFLPQYMDSDGFFAALFRRKAE